MLSIFRNVRFRSIIDSSQTKGLWRKKYISKVVLRKSYNGRKIYTDSLRALHRTFNSTQAENVLFSAFYTYKPYYVSKPTEKEKEACMCIDCLNPHLLLKSINAYRTSINLHEYQSSTTYLNELKVDSDNYDLFPETKMKKKYATMLMNGNSSATKEKMEMYSIPQQRELIKETRCLQ